jgi:hypothetical protein
VSKILNQIGYVSPIVIVSGLFVTYLVTPKFYLSYLLEEAQRERGVVEIVTFLSALIAGLIFLYSTWHLLQSGNWLAAGIVGSISVATLIFAGEEISWANLPGLDNSFLVERKFWWID